MGLFVTETKQKEFHWGFQKRSTALQDLRKWLGQLVTVVEKNSHGQVRCKLKSDLDRKDAIWLVPGALTATITTEKDGRSRA